MTDPIAVPECDCPVRDGVALHHFPSCATRQPPPDPIAAQPDDVVAWTTGTNTPGGQAVIQVADGMQLPPGTKLCLADALRREQAAANLRRMHAGTDHAMAAQPVPPSPDAEAERDVLYREYIAARTEAEAVKAERDALRDDLHGLRRSTQERIDRLESEGDNVHKLNMALVAERDALRAELAEDAGGWARAERAEAERDALRADAERYRHIRPMFRAFSAHVDGMHSWCATGELARMKGPTFDAAIDAAREGKA